jgi:hypothetical protein
LERVVTLAELSDYQGIVHTSSVVALELIDDFLLKEADILGLNLVG